MAGHIYQGTTPTLVFTVLDGVDVTTLGTPLVAVAQEDVYLSYSGDQVVLDAEASTATVRMSEADTLQLVAGVTAQAQLIFTDAENKTVVRFPIIELSVAETLADATLAAPVDPDETDGDVFDEDGEDVITDGEIVSDQEAEEYNLVDAVEYYSEDYDEAIYAQSEVEPWEG